VLRISQERFDQAVQAALDALPAEFRPYLDNVRIEVHDRPDPQLLSRYELPDDILGLYLGVPLEDKLLEGDPTPMPDRVLIFRDNLRAMCRSYADLVDEIRITLLHEIGHHFGLDEDRLSELGYE